MLSRKEIEDLMWIENHRQKSLLNKILHRIKDEETKELVRELHLDYNRCEALLLSELKLRINEYKQH